MSFNHLEFKGIKYAGSLIKVILCAFPYLFACVVIHPIDTESTNSPPSLRSTDDARQRGLAFDQIITIDLDETSATSRLELPVIIRDPDIQDELIGNVFINYDHLTEDGVFLVGFESSGSSSVERERSIIIPISLLNGTNMVGRCHRIELLVSREFQEDTDGGIASLRKPVTEGDLAQGVWWVAVIDDLHPTVNISTCPQ